MITYLFLPAVLAATAVFRFYHNTSIALWHDEAFSALYLRYPWPEMMQRIALDVHPPLYYLILRLWSYLAGDSLLSLRLLSIVFGVLTVWAIYLFVRTAFQSKILALLAALLLAVNPFQIQYALEARMYTLGTFLVALSSYFLTRALENKKYWLWYSLAVAAGIYTHYYVFLSVAAQGVFLLLWILKHRRYKTLLLGAGSYLLAGALYLPWLPSFVSQISQVGANYWIPPMNRWSIPGTLWKMAFGGQGVRNAILGIATLVTLALLWYFIKKVRSFHKWHVLFGVVVPIIGAVVLSLKTDLYLDRYFVFASLYFSALMTIALASISSRFWRMGLLGVLLASSVFAYLKNWDDLGIADKPGMAAAANHINAEVKPADRIYVGSSFVFFTFKYYNQTGIKPLLYSSEPLKNIPHFSGTAILTDNDLVLDLNKAGKGDTAWLLWTTGFGGSKTNVPENWQQQDERGFQDAPGFKGTIFVTKYKIN